MKKYDGFIDMDLVFQFEVLFPWILLYSFFIEEEVRWDILDDLVFLATSCTLGI